MLYECHINYIEVSRTSAYCMGLHSAQVISTTTLSTSLNCCVPFTRLAENAGSRSLRSSNTTGPLSPEIYSNYHFICLCHRRTPCAMSIRVSMCHLSTDLHCRPLLPHRRIGRISKARLQLLVIDRISDTRYNWSTTSVLDTAPVTKSLLASP